MEIKYSKQAEKFLARQTAEVSARIRHAIEQIPMGDIVKLQGQDKYRLRVGSYRVIFDRFGRVLFILKIDNRGDVYKSL